MKQIKDGVRLIRSVLSCLFAFLRGQLPVLMSTQYVSDTFDKSAKPFYFTEQKKPKFSNVVV